ncbi:hypothetical protein F4678DRAFT_483879 [Xylaria arbuscula]|nr:hypothetical protein F4678DRAFT_483879 [Xylaria arbuscula]
MKNSLKNEHVTKGNLFALVVLALLTLADNVFANTLLFSLGSKTPQTPGFWNLATTSLIISVVADLIGQLVLIFLTHYYTSLYLLILCMDFISIFNILLNSCILVFWRPDEHGWISAIAPMFKTIGGGSHTTAFLIITYIKKNNSSSLKAALVYMTGAVIVLCQIFASSITRLIAKQDLTLSYILSLVCCTLAGFVTIRDSVARAVASDQNWTADSMRPLLSHRKASNMPLGLIEEYLNGWHNMHSGARKSLTLLGWAIFLAAIAKATRPLFLTYVQHRVGLTPTAASDLLMIRTIMSLVIFSVVLPLVLLLSSKIPSMRPITINSHMVKMSIVLLAVGAVLIGAAQSETVLMSGLVINTLGVATDLALLAFAADVVPDNIASSFFMIIASVESAGTIVGIVLLYPLYQQFIDSDTLLGGVPYYICASLFTSAGIIIWSLQPLSIY